MLPKWIERVPVQAIHIDGDHLVNSKYVILLQEALSIAWAVLESTADFKLLQRRLDLLRQDAKEAMRRIEEMEK